MPDPQPIVLDTCVLVPSRLRDFLLSLAAEHAYQPMWNAVILDELEYHERRRHIDFGVPEAEADRIARNLTDQMNSAFTGSLVDNWEHLDGTFGLPDPYDEHVVAAAVVANAHVIVTDNLADFPSQALPIGVKAITPAAFTAQIARSMPQIAITALTGMAQRLRRPPMTPSAILDYMDTYYGFSETSTLMRPWL